MCAAFRRETVYRLDKIAELPAVLLRFAFFLSDYGLAGAGRAAPRAPGDRGGAAPPELRRAGPIALREIQHSQIVHASKRIGMLVAEHPLSGLERAPVKRLGLAMAALGLVQPRQFVHASKCIGMLVAEHPLAGLERAPEERFGLAMAALGLVQRRQIVHAGERIGMLLAEHPLCNGEGLLRDGGCLLVFALAV